MAAAWSLTGGLAGLDPVLPGAGAGGRRGLGLRPLDLRQLARRPVHVPDPPAGGRGQRRAADGEARQGDQGAGCDERAPGDHWSRSELRPAAAFLRDGSHGTVPVRWSLTVTVAAWNWPGIILQG